jgi:hypothetical protein
MARAIPKTPDTITTTQYLFFIPTPALFTKVLVTDIAQARRLNKSLVKAATKILYA